MPPYIDVFTPARAKGVFRIALAPLLSSIKVISYTLGYMKDITDLTNIPSLAPSASATYSASVVDNVTQCCVRLVAYTAAFPNITATPEIERLSVSLLA